MEHLHCRMIDLKLEDVKVKAKGIWELMLLSSDNITEFLSQSLLISANWR